MYKIGIIDLFILKHIKTHYILYTKYVVLCGVLLFFDFKLPEKKEYEPNVARVEYLDSFSLHNSFCYNMTENRQNKMANLLKLVHFNKECDGKQIKLHITQITKYFKYSITLPENNLFMLHFNNNDICVYGDCEFYNRKILAFHTSIFNAIKKEELKIVCDLRFWLTSKNTTIKTLNRFENLLYIPMSLIYVALIIYIIYVSIKDFYKMNEYFLKSGVEKIYREIFRVFFNSIVLSLIFSTSLFLNFQMSLKNPIFLEMFIIYIMLLYIFIYVLYNLKMAHYIYKILILGTIFQFEVFITYAEWSVYIKYLFPTNMIFSIFNTVYSLNFLELYIYSTQLLIYYSLSFLIWSIKIKRIKNLCEVNPELTYTLKNDKISFRTKLCSVILGKNGIGKTHLVESLGGFRKNKAVQNTFKSVKYVPQKSVFSKCLSLEENINIFYEKFSGKKYHHQYSLYKHNFCKNYDITQKESAHLAWLETATFGDFKMLILDDPSYNLSLTNKLRFVQELKTKTHLYEWGLIVATNDLDFASLIGDDIFNFEKYHSLKTVGLSFYANIQEYLKDLNLKTTTCFKNVESIPSLLSKVSGLFYKRLIFLKSYYSNLILLFLMIFYYVSFFYIQKRYKNFYFRYISNQTIHNMVNELKNDFKISVTYNDLTSSYRSFKQDLISKNITTYLDYNVGPFRDIYDFYLLSIQIIVFNSILNILTTSYYLKDLKLLNFLDTNTIWKINNFIAILFDLFYVALAHYLVFHNIKNIYAAFGQVLFYKSLATANSKMKSEYITSQVILMTIVFLYFLFPWVKTTNLDDFCNFQFFNDVCLKFNFLKAPMVAISYVMFFFWYHNKIPAIPLKTNSLFFLNEKNLYFGKLFNRVFWFLFFQNESTIITKKNIFKFGTVLENLKFLKKYYNSQFFSIKNSGFSFNLFQNIETSKGLQQQIMNIANSMNSVTYHLFFNPIKNIDIENSFLFIKQIQNIKHVVLSNELMHYNSFKMSIINDRTQGLENLHFLKFYIDFSAEITKDYLNNFKEIKKQIFFKINQEKIPINIIVDTKYELMFLTNTLKVISHDFTYFLKKYNLKFEMFCISNTPYYLGDNQKSLLDNLKCF